MKNSEKLTRFPKDVQEEVLRVLKGCLGAYVLRHENTGEYRVSTDIGITKGYDPWTCLAYIDIDEIYTLEEQRANFVEYWRSVDMSDF